MSSRPGISADPLRTWMERIDMVHEAVQAVSAAQRIVAQSNYRWRDKAHPGHDLYTALHEVELDCWRNLFMFALTLPDGERDRIKAAAKGRFLGLRHNVTAHLGEDWSPSKWSAASEDEFRERVREMFAPVEKEASDGE